MRPFKLPTTLVILTTPVDPEERETDLAITEFAVNNSYGIKAYNDTVYQYAKFANSMPNGCEDQIKTCRYAAANGEYNYSTPISSYSDPSVFSICSEHKLCAVTTSRAFTTRKCPPWLSHRRATTDSLIASAAVVPTTSVTPLTTRLPRPT
jgi:hypothetical protein